MVPPDMDLLPIVYHDASNLADVGKKIIEDYLHIHFVNV